MPILKKEVDIFPADLLGNLPEDSGKKPPVSETEPDSDQDSSPIVSVKDSGDQVSESDQAKPKLAFEDPSDSSGLWLPGDEESSFAQAGEGDPDDPDAEKWWCLYTMSRQEKTLMRKLHAAGKSFCCPLIENRYRSPAGRIRSSYLPLLTNYVFLKGTTEDRYFAYQTNCISKCNEVEHPEQLIADLFRLYSAIRLGLAVKAESRLTAGDLIEVRSGPFKGYEGNLIRREGKTRLLIHLRYLENGVSMEIDEALVRAV